MKPCIQHSTIQGCNPGAVSSSGKAGGEPIPRTKEGVRTPHCPVLLMSQLAIQKPVSTALHSVKVCGLQDRKVGEKYIPRTGEGLGASPCPGPAPGSTGGHALSVTSSKIHLNETCRKGKSEKTEGRLVVWGGGDTKRDYECIC